MMEYEGRMAAWFQVLADRMTIRVQTALMTAVLCAGAVILASGGAGAIARYYLIAEAKHDLQGLARSMSDRLGMRMHERYREITNLAQLPPLRRIWTGNASEIRETLEQVQSSLPAYTWLGFAGTDGKVIAATKGMLEGQSVSGRPWFLAGLKSAAVEDVHDAKLLDKILRKNPSDPPLRFVDIAVPVRSKEGKLVGVLGAHLSWAWANDLRDKVLDNRSHDALDLMIIGKDDKILLAPRNSSHVPQVVRDPQTGWKVQDDESSKPMLTVFSETHAVGDYPGLGWTVAARLPMSVVEYPAHVANRLILGFGMFLAVAVLVVAWFLAGSVTRPLKQLAITMDTIGRDPKITTVSRQHGSVEVLNLSLAIRSLLRRAGLAETMQREQEEANKQLDLDIKRLRMLAETDGLTGVLNRRAFLPFAAKALAIDRQVSRAHAVLMIDIDHFKSVNDTHGHQTGDEVLKHVARTIASEMRVTDNLARFGGEEFVVLLDVSVGDVAVEIADRVRNGLANTALITVGTSIRVTASIGVAMTTADDRDIDDAIARADVALYAAKAGGRNATVLYGDELLGGQAIRQSA